MRLVRAGEATGKVDTRNLQTEPKPEPESQVLIRVRKPESRSPSAGTQELQLLQLHRETASAGLAAQAFLAGDAPPSITAAFRPLPQLEFECDYALCTCREGHVQMEGRWTGVWAALAVLLGLAAPGSSYEVVAGPRNATVLLGSQARFNCTVSQGWKLLMWVLDGMVVLSVTPQGPIDTSERFTAESYDVDGNFVSEMVIHDVMGTLHIPTDRPVVKDEPCNVTCRASGWTPLPDISWEVGVPVSHSSYYSLPEPDDLHSAVSVLTLTPQGDGPLTCVARFKELMAHKAVTINLTVVPPASQAQGVEPGHDFAASEACRRRPCLPPGVPAVAVRGPLDRVTGQAFTGSSGPAEPHVSLPIWAIALLAASLSLLLILVIVLMSVLCCCRGSRREKKESSYEREIRKSANLKSSETSEAKSKGGNENYGYQEEGPQPTATTSLPSKLCARGAPDHSAGKQPGPVSGPLPSAGL
ncbi:PREDICTED: immunoglobulin superfamily member 5 [Condylura cristata]|uniref:immunoglobulin superfamily member 5 n=1 Tax=Condylura cristata TaxID=143302 RepID=UPI000642E82B|nr:PREDICTED: immunoglobulin superfamily member 5 [Condylura cristata]